MSTIGNHPAFPVSTADERVGHQDGPNTWQFTGLSIRDYFAAKAMQAICSHHDTWGLTDSEIACRAYTMADLMLAAREAP